MNAPLRLLRSAALCAALLASLSVSSTAAAQTADGAPDGPEVASPKPDALPAQVGGQDGAPLPAPAKPHAPPLLPTIVPKEEARQVRWNPRWRKFDWPNVASLGVGAAAAFGTLAIPPDETRWINTNSFDSGARDGLRLRKQGDRNTARDASDIMLVMSINQVLVDTLIVTWWGHGNEEVALQMALISTETLAINAGINGLVSALTSRERPYRVQCVGLQNEEWSDCRSNKRYRSFYSGHTSTTFAMAGLTCMHHAYLPLYGGGPGDGVVCAVGFGVAAATGAMRIAADQPWTSDVLVGAGAGTLSGLLLPWLLHYRTGDMPDAKPNAVTAQVVPTGSGAMVMGTF